MKRSILGLIVLASASVGFAAEKAPHCHQIVEACKTAGFKSKDWKNGDGLYVHCVDSIMGKPKNAKAPPMKAGLTVPTIAASDVQACLAENPNFDSGKKSK